MDQSVVVVMVVAAVVVVLAIAWIIGRQRHSRRLRERFGPEYDHVVDERGSSRRAERELDRRSRRVERLNIHPLSRDAAVRFAERWNAQQSRFVDDPKAAVVEADHLVEEVMTERGYPMSQFAQRVADISVDHPQTVENYRVAHEIAVRQELGQASTEDLRHAMIRFRELFRDLLDEQPPPLGVPNR
jgi:hypothetical protein